MSTVTPRASHTYLERSCIQSSVEVTTAARMMSPPIVGVLPLPACVSGVPARTTWCTCMARSRPRIHGPTTKHTSSDVIAAPAARNEM